MNKDENSVQLKEESEKTYFSQNLPPLPESFSRDLKKLTGDKSSTSKPDNDSRRNFESDRDQIFDYNSTQSAFQKKQDSSKISEQQPEIDHNVAVNYASLNTKDSNGVKKKKKRDWDMIPDETDPEELTDQIPDQIGLKAPRSNKSITMSVSSKAVSNAYTAFQTKDANS